MRELIDPVYIFESARGARISHCSGKSDNYRQKALSHRSPASCRGTHNPGIACIQSSFSGRLNDELRVRRHAQDNPLWTGLSVPEHKLYQWKSDSTYINSPPFFKGMAAEPASGGGNKGVTGARCLLNFGDSVTTDHISPAGSIAKDSPAAKWLLDRGVARLDWNSYGSRRGHDGTYACGWG